MSKGSGSTRSTNSRSAHRSSGGGNVSRSNNSTNVSSLSRSQETGGFQKSDELKKIESVMLARELTVSNIETHLNNYKALGNKEMAKRARIQLKEAKESYKEAKSLYDYQLKKEQKVYEKQKNK